MSYEALFEEIVKQTHIKGIRIGEFFKDFDPLRSGKCTPTQFARTMDRSAYILSPEDIQMLIHTYMDDEGKLVCYKRFTDEIENEFVRKDLTSSPTMATRSRNFTQGRLPTLSDQEENIYTDTMSFLQDLVAQRRMTIMEHFQDHDRLKNHHITAPQFKRCMPFSLKDQQLNVLVKKYSDGKPTDGVNYFQFVHDVSNPPVTRDFVPQWGNGTLTETVKPPKQQIEGYNVLSKIRAYVLKKQVRFLQFFTDFDKLRSGICRREHFRTAIGTSGISLTGEELDQLDQMYGIEGDSRIRYKQFVDDVNEVFGTPSDLEKRPLDTTSRGTLGNLIPARSPLLSEQTLQLANQTLEQIYAYARNHRPLTKPYFQSFDRVNSGQITPAHFRSTVFSHYGGSALTDEMLKALGDYYTDPTNDHVRYLDFLSDVEEQIIPLERAAGAVIFEGARRTRSMDGNQASSSQQDPYKSQFVQTAHRPPMPEFRAEAKARNITELMEKLKLSQLRDRVRFSEFFKDFDGLRTGLISPTRFRSGLVTGKIELSDREYEMLVNAYSDDDALVSRGVTSALDDRVQGQPVIKWVEFCQDVESIFTVSGLEKTPTRQMPPPGLATLRSLDAIDPVYSEKSPELVKLLDEYHVFVTTRRVIMKPTFQAFDKHNNGRITKQQFTQSLNTLGMRVDAKAVEELYKHYRDMKVPMDVNYLAFLRDVEKEKEEEPAVPLQTVKKRAKPETVTFEETIRRLRTMTRQRHIKWSEFFVDFDKMRSGYIPSERFRAMARNAGLELSEDEWSLLQAEYCDHPERPNFINHARFADDMDVVFTIKGFDTNPHLTPPDPLSLTNANPLKHVLRSLENEEEALVRSAVDKLHSLVKRRNLFMKPHLQDFDRLHNGHITVNQFRGSCGTLGVTFESMEQQEALIRKFSDKLGFLYREFVDACETGKY